MLNLMIRSLAEAIQSLSQPSQYWPRGSYRSEAPTLPYSYSPLKVEMSQYFSTLYSLEDRPIYALRAPCFKTEEKTFNNLDEAIQNYF